MSDIIAEFNDYRSKMNEKILNDNNKIIKRIFNLEEWIVLSLKQIVKICLRTINSHYINI